MNKKNNKSNLIPFNQNFYIITIKKPHLNILIFL